MTYATECKQGYNNLQNSGKYNPSCTANTINILWKGINTSRLALANNQGNMSTKAANGTDNLPANTGRSTVAYDGNIYTPVSPLATDAGDNLPGQTFVGWRFVK